YFSAFPSTTCSACFLKNQNATAASTTPPVVPMAPGRKRCRRFGFSAGGFFTARSVSECGAFRRRFQSGAAAAALRKSLPSVVAAANILSAIEEGDGDSHQRGAGGGAVADVELERVQSGESGIRGVAHLRARQVVGDRADHTET